MVIWNKDLVNLRSLMMIAVAVILSGCATPFFGYGANGQSREEFARHVEEGFRLQNSMTSQVMMLLDGGEVKNSDALVRAEQHMEQICGPLNEYASRDIDGLNIGFLLQRRVEQSAIDCEKAAREVEFLLEGF
ncbi:MAG: hypothetical protein WC685_12115 [Methylobacter sp.]|jgi:hypothetical protein